MTLACIIEGMIYIVSSGLRGVGSGSDPSTIPRILWSFNVAWVVTSQILYSSDLKSRNVIFLNCALSSAMMVIVCINWMRISLKFLNLCK